MLVVAIPSAVLVFFLLVGLIYFIVSRSYAPPKPVGEPYWKAVLLEGDKVSTIKLQQLQNYSKGEPKQLQISTFGQVEKTPGQTVAEFNDLFMTMLAEAGHRADIFTAASFVIDRKK